MKIIYIVMKINKGNMISPLRAYLTKEEVQNDCRKSNKEAREYGSHDNYYWEGITLFDFEKDN